jgi:hypothetical protein
MKIRFSNPQQDTHDWSRPHAYTPGLDGPISIQLDVIFIGETRVAELIDSLWYEVLPGGGYKKFEPHRSEHGGKFITWSRLDILPE